MEYVPGGGFSILLQPSNSMREDNPLILVSSYFFDILGMIYF